MEKLWGGRFESETDPLVFHFNASITFDKRLASCDLKGSMAHARMLGETGVLSAEDTRSILDGLASIKTDLDSGELEVDMSSEDIHSFIEAELTRRIGEAGKKLHTGRSRNDQVALDMRLYTRDHIDHMRLLLMRPLTRLLWLMQEYRATVMPGFTHLQKAQPVTLGHHLGAYFFMLARDMTRLSDLRARMNECPLGSGALAGTTYPIDREMTARELGFDAPCANSMDGVSDRDYLLEYLSDLSILAMHLSRACEEMILWNSDEYRFVEMSDTYSTGSSIMPQKKNPDVCELIRGKTGRVYGDLVSLLVTMKGTPLAYNKDMQEDKEAAFDAMETVDDCVLHYAGLLESVRFNEKAMAASARGGFTNATDLADYLVGKGVPFRDAHRIAGEVVRACIRKSCAIEDLSLDQFRAFSPAFDSDVLDAITMEACIGRRNSAGACGPEAMAEQIRRAEAFLDEQYKSF